jgi:release factor glutamine methyltransferase
MRPMSPNVHRWYTFSRMIGKTLYPTVDAILKEAAKKLRPKKMACAADRDAGWLEAEILLAHVLKKDRAWAAAHGNDRLSVALRKRFDALVRRRAKGEPAAYIVGYREFYGRPFRVNRHTLIPRPETELFIDVLKRRIKRNDRFLLWDAGTGCGNIAVTAALEFPNARIVASDVCRRALKAAEKNAKAHGVSKRIAFVHGDLLGPDVKKKIERSVLPLVIAANLPYLPDRDAKKLEKDVVDFEPRKALFGGKDGLDLIRRVLAGVSDKLNVLPKTILIEFDPPQSKAISAFAKKIFPGAKTSVHKDLAGKHRLMEVRF